MIRYSKDVNVYVESKSSMCKMKLPVPQRAAGVYRHPSVAKNLEDPNARDITEDTLRNDYIQARELLVSEIITVYQILNAKGGLTSEEWTYFVSSITKSKFIFPDISLELGTNMKFQIDQESSETLLKQILSEHGFRLKLIPSSRNAILYEDENEFLSMLSSKLSVNLDFENMEKRLDSADYSGTKKRLHYLTIYDFLKYHFGINELIPKEDLIHTLETSKDRSSANIIAFCDFVKNFKGDFWSEYEKYREYKMVEVLARWFGQSDVRILSGEAYNYFADCINEPMFTQVLQLLKVHTASLNTCSCKANTEGDTVKYSFHIQNCRGNITACVSSNKYDSSFINSSKKIKLTSSDSLIITNLEYNKIYYVSLWEVIGQDALKIAELPHFAIKKNSSIQVKKNSSKNMTPHSSNPGKRQLIKSFQRPSVTPIEEFKYRILPNGGAEILEYIGKSSTVYIPSKFIDNNLSIIDVKIINFNKGKGLPNNVRTIYFPDKLTVVNKSSLQGCKMVKSVIIPSSVRIIEDNAFNSCYNLEEVVIEQEELYSRYDYLEIGCNSFKNCESLKQICLPSYTRAIGKGAFEYCVSLENVTIPGSVTMIEKFVFTGCKSIKSVVFLDGVARIEAFALLDCPNLETVTIPYSVKKISIYAFYNGLKSFFHKITILGKDKSYAQEYAKDFPSMKFISQ